MKKTIIALATILIAVVLLIVAVKSLRYIEITSPIIKEDEIVVLGNTVYIKYPYGVVVTGIGNGNENNTGKCCTFSMRPTLGCGHQVIVTKPKSVDDLKVNDIIGAYEKEGKMFWHRIVEIDKKNNCAWTKGDNNFARDNYCTEFEDIKYRVLAVIY